MTKQHSGRWRWPALLIVSALLLAGCDWPMFRYGPAHTGFNNTETTIGVGNVANLRPLFTTGSGSYFDGSVVVANGVLYGVDDVGLTAYDATGATGCSGTPKTCAPLWVGHNMSTDSEPTTPAVASGVVFLATANNAQGGNLAAYDANGVTGCSGTPKTCRPLWTAALESGNSNSSPTVANGIVYISDWGTLYAFDANGIMGCSGTPKTCSPLWSSPDGGSEGGDADQASPAVANGVVYTGGYGLLHAFDANGVTGCSGTPKVCSPLWSTFTESVDESFGSPVVANGLVYYFGGVYDANGVTGCSGTPKVCSPLWEFGSGRSPAIANGVLYVSGGHFNKTLLHAYDALTGAPLWSSTAARDFVNVSPVVANGVVYIAADDDHLYAFDASGTTGCSVTPKVCSPLVSFANAGQWVSAAIANGRVYIDGYAFGLP